MSSDSVWCILEPLAENWQARLLCGDKVVIGRSRSSDIIVRVSHISSAHVEITRGTSTDAVCVADMGSANGTLVNGQRLVKGQRVQLTTGDTLSLVVPPRHPCSRDFSAWRIRIPRPVAGQPDPVLAAHLASGKAMWCPADSSTADSALAAAAADSHAAGSPARHGPVPGAPMGTQDDEAELSVREVSLVDHFEVHEQLGSGSYGVVRRGVDRHSSAEVAIKIIPKTRAKFSSPKHLADLLREVRLMRRIRHPAIVRLLDGVADEDNLYIVTELARGGELFQHLLDNGAMPEQQAKVVAARLLSALAYLHARNIVHRDIKPENVLITDASDPTSVKLADFGVAKRLRQDGLASFVGSLQYVAPEVLERASTVRGMGRYTASVDLYSFGVMLYVCLSGRPPYSADDVQDGHSAASSWSFEGDPWPHVSTAARQLVAALMDPVSAARPSAATALQSAWFGDLRGDPAHAELFDVAKFQHSQASVAVPLAAAAEDAAVARPPGDGGGEQPAAGSKRPRAVAEE